MNQKHALHFYSYTRTLGGDCTNMNVWMKPRTAASIHSVIYYSRVHIDVAFPQWYSTTFSALISYYYLAVFSVTQRENDILTFIIMTMIDGMISFRMPPNNSMLMRTCHSFLHNALHINKIPFAWMTKQHSHLLWSHISYVVHAARKKHKSIKLPWYGWW